MNRNVLRITFPRLTLIRFHSDRMRALLNVTSIDIYDSDNTLASIICGNNESGYASFDACFHAEDVPDIYIHPYMT